MIRVKIKSSKLKVKIRKFKIKLKICSGLDQGQSLNSIFNIKIEISKTTGNAQVKVEVKS